MERFFVKIKNNVYFKVDNFLAVIAEFLSHSYGFDVFYSWRFDGNFCHFISCLEKYNDSKASYGFIVKSILSPS